VTDSDEEKAMMLDLLQQGVPWYLAREAIASVRMSKEDE
jgi:hypothetical protein